jgi:polysaccharide deacetylase family protein (PEP-CTERM system associated)
MTREYVNVNLLTFDVEDYYHIFYRNFFSRTVEPTDEVVRCTHLILDTLAEFQQRATFFIVGKVATSYPDLVKLIYRQGHEIGSHSYGHIYINRITPTQFREDLIQSVDSIASITGEKPTGYRAPEFSIDETNPWAFEILSEMGFSYDSSLFPGRGKLHSPMYPHEIKTGTGSILEIPLSAVSVAGRRIPAAGGGFLRLFPMAYNRWAIDKMNTEGRGAVVYMHPYEFEESPRSIDYRDAAIKQKAKAWLMHMRQLHNRCKSLSKLRWLLSSYHFTSIEEAFDLRSKPDAHCPHQSADFTD